MDRDKLELELSAKLIEKIEHGLRDHHGADVRLLARLALDSIWPEIEQIITQRDAYQEQWMATQDALVLTRNEALEALAEQRERFSGS